jgi:antitoxin StbD
VVSQVLTEFTASVAELKKNPMGIVASAGGAPVAIVNRNAPAFYCVPADLYGQMLDALEDAELNALADTRGGGPFVSVHLSDV